MSEKEIFDKNLSIFDKSSPAEVFFRLVADVLKTHSLDFSSPKLVMGVSEAGALELFIKIGNTPILSSTRDRIGLHVYFLLPEQKLKTYQKDQYFLKNKKPVRKSVLLSFDLESFNMDKYSHVLNDWHEAIEEVLAKPGRTYKTPHNYYFYEVIYNAEVQQEVLKQIDNMPEEGKSKFRHEREVEEEEDEPKYSFSPDEVDIGIEQKSLDILINRMRYGEIDMNPDFQRSIELWDKKVMSRLIESIILDLPLPAFYFDASNKSKWVVVDGLQRLSTLQKFVVYAEKNHPEYKNRLKLTGLEILTEYNNTDYNELPGRVKRQMSEFTVILYLIKPGTPQNVKYSIFHRVNTGGLRLKAQEIRNALNQEGKAPQLLRELSNDEVFKKTINISPKRMHDREIVLRFLAFQILKSEEYKGSISRFLDTAIERLNEQPELHYQLKDKFRTAIHLSQYVFGEHAFSKSILGGKNDFNSPLFDVWMYYFSQANEQEIKHIRKNKHQIIEGFKKLLLQQKDKQSLYDAITIAPTDSTRVKRRFHIIGDLLSDYISNISYFWQKEELYDTENTH